MQLVSNADPRMSEGGSPAEESQNKNFLRLEVTNPETFAKGLNISL